MAFLYITEQGSVLRKTGDRLIVNKEGEVLLDLPCHKIEAVLIFGNVQFTTQAVHELSEHGIELAIMSRRGKLIAQLTSPMTKNVELRIAQYERYRDSDFILRISKAIVAGKILNSLEYLRRFSYNHTDVDLKKEIETLQVAHEEARKQPTVQSLLGIEGHSAKVYYNSFGKMIRGDFQFHRRQKHPAPDPVNALLSFGYTLIFNEISSLLDGLGFDPYLGFFHKPEYGRASLAADLLEEFRSPIADRLTLRLINNHMLKKEDFFLHAPSGSMHLKDEPLKRYLKEYERCMNEEFPHPETKEKTCFRECLRLQAQKLARVIVDNSEYLPFHYDR